MSVGHSELVKKAKEILKEKGFDEGQIHEEFGFKNYRIDVVGWSEEKKIAVDCGYCDHEKLKDLQKFFDEVICLSFESWKPSMTPDMEPLGISKKSPLDSQSGLKLLLIKGDGILLDMPLLMEDWPRDRLENELASLEADFGRFSKLFDALSHETRLRMMKHLLEDKDQTISFAEFMRDLSLNPKIVWENTRKLRESGLLEKVEKGKYRCSEFGRVEFMMRLALRRVMKVLEELERL